MISLIGILIISESFNVGKTVSISRKKFDENKQEIAKRCDYLTSGLEGMGLVAKRLDTQALIELFYNIYNPVTSYEQKMTDINKLQVEQDSGTITNK